MSHFMRKPDFCIYAILNKGAHQLRDNPKTDQHLGFATEIV